MSDLSIILLVVISFVQVLFVLYASRYEQRAEDLDALLSEAGQAVRQLHRLQDAYEKLLRAETSQSTFSVN